MKKIMTICTVVMIMASMAMAAFDNPNYTYTKIYDVAAGVQTSEAQFSPDGTKILWGESLSDWSQMSVKYGNWNPITKTITGITTVATATGGAYAYNAKWSPDSSYIGYAKAASTDTPISFARYRVSDGDSSIMYAPNDSNVSANFDFYGNNDSIVFWASSTGGADLFTYNGTTRSQLTSTSGITEYEPRTFGTDTSKVLYWSGEGSGETNRVVAVLNTDGSIETVVTGTTGKNLGPYWAVWGKDQSYVGVVDAGAAGATELLLYKKVGGIWTLAQDLTGSGYTPGAGDWNFFGSFLADGSFCFQSQVGNAGRDIWFAEVPEPATMSLLALGGLGLLRRKLNA